MENISLLSVVQRPSELHENLTAPVVIWQYTSRRSLTAVSNIEQMVRNWPGWGTLYGACLITFVVYFILYSFNDACFQSVNLINRLTNRAKCQHIHVGPQLAGSAVGTRLFLHFCYRASAQYCFGNCIRLYVRPVPVLSTWMDISSFFDGLVGASF